MVNSVDLWEEYLLAIQLYNKPLTQLLNTFSKLAKAVWRGCSKTPVFCTAPVCWHAVAA